jgi:DNA-binding NtrC family response regulator
MKGRKRIFIIDAEIDLCLLMKTYFLRKQYDVSISHTAYDALSRINEYQPNIVFLASTACQNPKEDIKKIKESAPDAEIIVDSYQIFGEA